jgi:excisionase family DNA binding protein
MAKVLTTGEAAKRCGVSLRTVIRWIERGRLQAYRLPDRGDYRITPVELQHFMQRNDIPDLQASAQPSRQVLIVDDDPGMVRAIARVLARAGFETLAAEDGFVAGSLLQRLQPGLMILDLHMPRMDGLAVLDYLRQHPPGFPLKILVVSGDTPERLQQAQAHGADAVLGKPFANEALLAAVRQLYGASPVAEAAGGAHG